MLYKAKHSEHNNVKADMDKDMRYQVKN